MPLYITKMGLIKTIPKGFNPLINGCIKGESYIFADPIPLERKTQKDTWISKKKF
jgi:hypothetical protein